MSGKSSLLINEPPLQVLPSLAIAVGLNEAIVLQQLHYWLENPKSGEVRNGHKWIFNTYDEWHENFPFWSIPTIQRIFSSLEEKRIVIAEQLDKHKHDMRKFYRIDYAVLCMMEHINLIPSTISNGHDDNSNTESHSQTTTDIKNGAQNAPLSIENQIAIGVDKITMPTEDMTFRVNSEIAITNICKGATNIIPLTEAFLDSRRIHPTKSQYKGWRMAFLEMYALGVRPEHIRDAVKKLTEDNMTVVDPFAIKKTAVSLANPMPKDTAVKAQDVAI